MRAGGKTTFGPKFGIGAAQLYGGVPKVGGASAFAPRVGTSLTGHAPSSRSTFTAAQKLGHGLIDPRQRHVPAIFSERHAGMMMAGADTMLAKPLPMASWVEVADFGSGPIEPIPLRLQEVRRRGIQSRGDIGSALEYLAEIDDGLAEVVKVVMDRLAEGKLKIELDPKRGDSAAAELSFQGRIDRASNEFGERILVPKGAGPDALLHEIFHVLPLEIVEQVFSGLECGNELPALPWIDPGASFRKLRAALLAHARAHETISFGAMCKLYESEAFSLIHHVFHSDMMSDLYGAYERDGLRGIAAVFPYYMMHYELREGHVASLLALVIKVEGRTDLTWDEYEGLVSRYETRELGLLEDYLKRYVTDRGLDVPPDFFSTVQTANRELRKSLAAGRPRGGPIERIAQASFDALEIIEGQSFEGVDEAVGMSELAPGDIPPKETQADRRTIFAAYAGVVDRVLDNPPAAFTREELASLVSFSRLLPPQMALTLARRLKVYLLDVRDLSVMLGLALCEKGLTNEGGRMVMESLDLATLGKTREAILDVMGEEFVTSFLKDRLQRYREQRDDVSPAFRIWAQEQFLVDEGTDIEADLAEFFGHPEVLTKDGWHELGLWLIEHPSDMDYVPDDSELLIMPDRISRTVPSYADLLVELKALGKEGRLGAQASLEVERMRAEIMESIRKPLDALMRIVAAGGDHAESLDVRKIGINGLGFLSRQEVDDILDGVPEPFRTSFAVEADIARLGWWSHPERTLEEIEGALEVLEDLPDRSEAEVQQALHEIYRSFARVSAGMRYGRLSRSEPLASMFPSLLEAYLGSIDRHHSDIVDMQIAHSNDYFEPLGVEHEDPLSDNLEVRSFLPYLTKISGMSDYSEEFNFNYVHKLEWLHVLARIDGEHAGAHLRRAMDELRRLWDVRGKVESHYYYSDDVEMELIDLVIVPHAVSLLLEASRQGEEAIAGEAYDFLFDTVTSAHPQDEPFYDAYDERKVVGSWGELSEFLSRLDEIDWALRLEMDRLRAVRDGNSDVWIDRVRREVDRGGANVTVRLLRYFSREFRRIEDRDGERDMLRLMMVASVQGLGSDYDAAVAGVKETTAAIHAASLGVDEKDEMLAEYLETLVALVVTFRGVDLNMLSKLGDLLPWRATDAISEGVPHYPKAEQVMVRALAGIPELVEERKGKNDRARLGAFAAAGLPLQRHARWLEHLSSDPASLPELAGLAVRRDYGTALAGLGLPHPYDVPNRVSTEWAKEFLAGNGDVIAAVVDEGDPARTELVLRVLRRVLGSEIAHIVDDTKARDYYEERVLAGSATANFIVNLLTERMTASEMSPASRGLMEVLFEAGPQSVRRLDAASDLIRVASTREEFQAIFDAATEGLIFGNWTRARLEELRQGEDGEAELEFMERLLALHHSRHPGGVVSDFFIRRFVEDEGLRRSYWQHVADEGGDVDPLVIVELGSARADYHMAGSRAAIARADDYLRMNFLERYSTYLNAVKFLKAYVERAGVEFLQYADEYRFDFQKHASQIFKEDPDTFAELIFGTDQESRSAFMRAFRREFRASSHMRDYLDSAEMDERIDHLSVMLMDAGWHIRVNEVLDNVSTEGPLLKREDVKYLEEEEEYSLKEREIDPLKNLLDEIGAEVERLETEYAEMSREHLREMTAEANLPEFIGRQEGLKRDVLVWAFVSLDPAQKNTIRAKLGEARSDEERLLIMGQAAHFEKLLQLASIHPAVPAELQELFSVFQEDVPHRDEIDAQKTLKWAFVDSQMESLEVDLQRPIKEGTIGGVYRATYRGEPVVIKLMPKGKEEDLNDSLRIVKDIRRFLAADGYSASGARALDDFLSFYERTMTQEMDLSLEVENADVFEKLLLDHGLSESFVVPQFLDELASVNAVAMRPLPSRRLGSLSDEEREVVFERIDEELIPAMFEEGVFHFDLHPGNIGLAEDGRIVLYDVGRVHMLTVEETAALKNFFEAAMRARSGEANGELRKALAMLGTVHDKEAFAQIDELLQVLVESDDPISAVEEIYPRLSEYGFRLGDSYVKLLLMQLTWEGTKEHLRARANGRS